MEENIRRYFVAISLIKNLGHKNARKLISACGGPEAVFNESRKNLVSLKLKSTIIDQIQSKEIHDQAEKEIRDAAKHNIEIITLRDSRFPFRLTQCDDAPLVLYVKGKADLNNEKVVAIVGTRRSSLYGETICAELIQELSGFNLLIVSGLAYGIDTKAHENALKQNLETASVLAHGLDRLYPYKNKKLAAEIVNQGCLVSDFPVSSSLLPGNFPARNRIIAGLSDAVIVVESGIKGGSLITADIANSYNREVFAFPGKVSNSISKGCHWLIKTNRAALIENAADLITNMNWDFGKQKNLQPKLFENFTPEEQSIIDVLNQTGEIRIDEISLRAKLSINRTTSLLTILEFKNAIKSFPGKIYAIHN